MKPLKKGPGSKAEDIQPSLYPLHLECYSLSLGFEIEI